MTAHPLLSGLASLAVAATALLASASDDTPADGLDWPRAIEVPKGRIVIYQPQLETFEGVDLAARAAVSVTPAGSDEPVFGAVWLAARVDTDRVERIVRLESVEVTDAKFPGAQPEQLAELEELIEAEIVGWDPEVSLDRLLTMLEVIEKRQESARGLKHNPPRILVRTHPAILVTLDGAPKLRSIEGSRAMQVVNTPYLMLFDPGSSSYYLTDSVEWLASPSYEGPWKLVAEPPAELVALVPMDAGGPGLDAEIQGSGTRPEIIVATEPTELIAMDGEPTWSPIGAIGLLYATNTDSDVFLEIETQLVFVLISGRWYAAPGLGAKSWAYVAPEDLPQAFAAIPPESEKARVRSSVAGTDEAVDAVHEAAIPQTASVSRDETIAVEYDGPPSFEAVEGTEVSYALNTADSVLRVGDLYYCCREGVWYVSDEPVGPWVVCVTVPPEVYELPPSCPVYSVTYVYVYDSTPDVVYVGYTPGYVGCFVAGAVVVYGTGWVYRPWYGNVYVARQSTWGFAVRYNPWTGGWGAAVGYRGPYGGGVVVGRTGGWWGVGGYRGFGEREYSRTVETPLGTFEREIEVDRDWDGVDIDDKIEFTPNENLYERQDERQERVADRPERERPGPGSERERPEPGSERAGPGERRTGLEPGARNDVFADREGNVHRRTEQGWQSRESGRWSQPKVEAPSAGGPRGSTDRRSGAGAGSSRSSGSTFNREARSRERGTQRTRDFRSRVGGRSAGRGSRGGRGRG